MTEKKKSVLLLGLLAFGGALFYFNWNDGPASGSSRNSAEVPYTPLAVDSLALRVDKLERSRKTEYKSSGRDVFTEAAAAAPHVVKQPDRAFNPIGPTPAPPPEPPKLPANVKYFGYGTIPNGALKRAFLTDGEDIFIVGEGDTLLGRYRILRIGPAHLEFEEISGGMRGTAPLEEQAAPSQ